MCHLCKACRSAAVKFCPETARGNRHGICREISGESLLLLYPQETKLESAWDFSRQISRHFSPDTLQLQMPNFMAFFILQTFVPNTCCFPYLPVVNKHLRFLREAKPGGFQTGGFPTFSGKGPDCVADPFGTVRHRCS